MMPKFRLAILAAIITWGGMTLPAQAWWITLGFDYNNWRNVRDGHEWITAEALKQLGTTFSDAESREILFGVRDNDQAESNITPFGGAEGRHHADVAQKTHSMLPNLPEYLGKSGSELAARDAKGYVIWAVGKGLEAFVNLPQSNAQCLAACRASGSRAGFTMDGGTSCERECNVETLPLHQGWAGGATRMGARDACIQRRRCASLPQGKRQDCEYDCAQEGRSWVDLGFGRPSSRTSQDVEQNMPGDAVSRYNGLRWLGKGLHALQDSYSCAHAVRRTAGGPICELLAYQGVCTPGGSKLHKSIDEGDNTGGSCSGQARAAIAATKRVLQAFATARAAILGAGRGQTGEQREQAQRAIWTTQKRTAVAGAVSPTYQFGNCYHAYPPPPATFPPTWNERRHKACVERCTGGQTRRSTTQIASCRTDCDTQKRVNPIRTENGQADLKVLAWNVPGVSADRHVKSVSEDRRRRERDLICAMRTGSDTLSEVLDLQWERLGDNCKQLPTVIFGNGSNYGSFGQYFRENWPCASDAILHYWLRGLQEYQRDKARLAGMGNLHALTGRARQDYTNLSNRLRDLWTRNVCAKWRDLRTRLQGLLSAWQDAERRLGAIKDQIAGIMACTGLAGAREFIRFRQEDVTEAWSRFKERFDAWKVQQLNRLRRRASEAFTIAAGERAGMLRRAAGNLADWWQNTCLVEEGGVFPTVIAPLLATPARLAVNVLGPAAQRAYDAMSSAQTWLRTKATEIGSALWSTAGRAATFIRERGSAIFGALSWARASGAAGGAARSVEGGLNRTRNLVCSIAAPLRHRIEQAVAWARGTWAGAEQAVRRVVRRAQQEWENRQEMVRRFEESGWRLIERHGRAAFQALERFGRQAVALYQGCRDAFVASGNQTVMECIGEGILAPARDAAARARERAAQAARTAERVVRQAFNAVGYGVCLVGSCARSPLQCARGNGTEYTRDIGRCDRRYHYSSSATIDKVRYLACMVRCCASSALQCRRGHGSDFTPCVRRCQTSARRTPPRPTTPPPRVAAAPAAAPHRPTPPAEPAPTGPERGAGTGHASGLVLQDGVQRPGSTYRSYDASRRSPDGCATSCSRSRRCQAFTWQRSTGRCELKRTVGRTRRRAGFVSGYKRDGSERASNTGARPSPRRGS